MQTRVACCTYLVVLFVVQLHDLAADDWLKGAVVIRQVGQLHLLVSAGSKRGEQAGKQAGEGGGGSYGDRHYGALLRNPPLQGENAEGRTTPV